MTRVLLVLIIAFDLHAAPRVSAWAVDGETLSHASGTRLMVHRGERGALLLEVTLDGSSKEVAIPTPSHEGFAQVISFGRVRAIHFFDATRIWVVTHLSPQMDCSFLFDLQSEQFLAELPGVDFLPSPDGQHMAYCFPLQREPVHLGLYVDGIQVFPPAGTTSLESTGLRLWGGPVWTEDGTVEFVVASLGADASAEQRAAVAPAAGVLMRVRPSEVDSRRLLAGTFALSEEHLHSARARAHLLTESVPLDGAQSVDREVDRLTAARRAAGALF